MSDMTQEDSKQSALVQIAEQVAIAQQAIAKAEEIAKANQVGFTFEFNGIDGWFQPYRNPVSGEGFGYWEGWAGSSC